METGLSTLLTLLDTLRELHGRIDPDELANAASDIAQVLRTEGEKTPEGREQLAYIVKFINQELTKVNGFLALAAVKTAVLPNMRQGLVQAGYLTEEPDTGLSSPLADSTDAADPQADAPAALPEIPSGGIGFEIREGNAADGMPIERYAFSADSPPIKLGTKGHIKRGGHWLLAYITRSDGGVYTIVDMGSGHGTYVNGEKIYQTHLTDGDKIIVGNDTLWVCMPS